MLTLLGFTFGFLELLVIGAFLIAMIVSVSFDRHGEPAPKWVVTMLGIGALLFFTKENWTVQTLMSFALSSTFWVPLLKYMGLGFLYTIVEFIRGVRMSKHNITEAYADHLDRDSRFVLRNYGSGRDAPHLDGSVRELFAKAAALPADTAVEEERRVLALARQARVEFCSMVRSKSALVSPTVTSTGEFDVAVNKGLVAMNVGPWVMFWPFYLLSLVVGDLLAEMFSTFADYLSTIGGKYVRAVFKDVFKF